MAEPDTNAAPRPNCTADLIASTELRRMTTRRRSQSIPWRIRVSSCTACSTKGFRF